MALLARDIAHAQHWSGPVISFHSLVNSRRLLKERRAVAYRGRTRRLSFSLGNQIIKIWKACPVPVAPVSVHS